MVQFSCPSIKNSLNLDDVIFHPPRDFA